MFPEVSASLSIHLAPASPPTANWWIQVRRQVRGNSAAGVHDQICIASTTCIFFLVFSHESGKTDKYNNVNNKTVVICLIYVKLLLIKDPNENFLNDFCTGERKLHYCSFVCKTPTFIARLDSLNPENNLENYTERFCLCIRLAFVFSYDACFVPESSQ